MLCAAFKKKVKEVISEPAHNWNGAFQTYRNDEDGEPLVRLAVTNCAIDLDIWKDVRNPAQVGMYPLTFDDIWKHHAAANLKSTRFDGSESPLVVPEPFDTALGRYGRAVIISGMLAVNPQVFEAYAEKIAEGDSDPFDYYARATEDVAAIVERSLDKVALFLMADQRAVIPMTRKKVDFIVERTRAEYLRGRYHGPCNDHWPQNSIAVMTGLLRFGVNRLPFRDEVSPSGDRQRLFGRYGSIVIFDAEPIIEDGSDGMALLDTARLLRMRDVSDYTCVDPAVVEQRYCTYNTVKPDQESTCAKCLETCPSTALANSSPGPDGGYNSRISAQEHRFWDGTLDFDYRNCSRDRTQKRMLFDDYVCARCEVLCAAEGLKKSRAEIQAINGE